MVPAVITGPADLRDQRWLDGQVAVLGDGIKAAKEIWANWSEGRKVGRLHPGQTPGQYLASLGLKLPPRELAAGIPDISTPELATATGVSQPTAWRARQAIQSEYPQTPTTVLGADGKRYPARRLRSMEAELVEAPEDDGTDDSPKAIADRFDDFFWDDVRDYVAAIPKAIIPRGTMHDAVYAKRHSLTRALLAAFDEWRESMG